MVPTSFSKQGSLQPIPWGSLWCLGILISTAPHSGAFHEFPGGFCCVRKLWFRGCLEVFGNSDSYGVCNTAELSTNALRDFVVFWHFCFPHRFPNRGAFNHFPGGFDGVWQFWFPRGFPHSGAFYQFSGGCSGVWEFWFPHRFQHSGAFNQFPKAFWSCLGILIYTSFSAQRSFQHIHRMVFPKNDFHIVQFPGIRMKI